MAGCCPLPDLSGNSELVLGETRAEPDIGSSLPNKSDIRRVPDQTTVFLFSPKIYVSLKQSNYEE